MTEPTKDAKLIPEWSVDEDDQVVLAGLAALAALLLVLGWSWWRGDDNGVDDSPLAAATETAGVNLDGDADGDLNDNVAAIINGSDTDLDTNADTDGDTDTDTDTDTDQAVDTTAPSTTAVVPLDLGPDVAAAVSSFGIDSTVDGDVATLSGYVGSDEESSEAEANAGDVAGIVSVENNLEVLLPSVTDALQAAGVVNATPTVVGQTATAIGVIATEDDRAAALAAVEAVPGVQAPAVDRLKALKPDVDAALGGAGVEGPASVVTITPGAAGAVVVARGAVADEAVRTRAIEAIAALEGVESVTDELTMTGALAADLNEILELEPIQFATASDQILEASYPTLDRIAELMATDSATQLEIQGYTDTRGPESSNLSLSQARADAVLAYLTTKGIPAEQLTATGYGETTQFGDTDAANRRVRFEVAPTS